jgi:hypothetical protein
MVAVVKECGEHEWGHIGEERYGWSVSVYQDLVPFSVEASQ